MHPFRRTACIVIGLAFIVGGAFILEPMIEAQRFFAKAAVGGFFLLSVGGLLALMGTFPNLTRDW